MQRNVGADYPLPELVLLLNRSVKEILERRGIQPLLGHVFLPIDMSSFRLPDAYWVEDDYKLPEGPDGEHVIYLNKDKEVLMQPNNNSWGYPIYYGKGALYSQLGIEPGEDPPYLSSSRLRQQEANCKMTVFVRVTPYGSRSPEEEDTILASTFLLVRCKPQQGECAELRINEPDLSAKTNSQFPGTRKFAA